MEWWLISLPPPNVRPRPIFFLWRWICNRSLIWSAKPMIGYENQANSQHYWHMSWIEPNWAELSRIEPNWAKFSQIEPNWADITTSAEMTSGFVRVHWLSRTSASGVHWLSRTSASGVHCTVYTVQWGELGCTTGMSFVNTKSQKLSNYFFFYVLHT